MIVLWFILGALFANIIGAIIMMAAPEFFSVYGNIIVYPLMFLPAMGYNYKVSRSGKFFGEGMDLDNSNFAPLNLATCAVLVAVATLACAFAAEPIPGLLPDMPAWLEEALSSLTEGPLLVSILCACIFAPLFEEWLCRGTILRGLLCKMKPVYAITLSALFFAAIHLNPWQGIPAFMLGCLFGWVYYKTGSLKLTMLMHCVNNTVSVILSRIPSLENADSFRDVINNDILYAVIIVVCLAVLALCIKELSKIDEKVLSHSESI